MLEPGQHFKRRRSRRSQQQGGRDGGGGGEGGGMGRFQLESAWIVRVYQEEGARIALNI